MIDHAHSIVIGETAVVGDNVSMLHSVTLGGTGKEDGDRHPKIGNGVLIGAGAAVLGNIRGRELQPNRRGIRRSGTFHPARLSRACPARMVGEAGCAEPSKTMDQLIGDRISLNGHAPRATAKSSEHPIGCSRFASRP